MPKTKDAFALRDFDATRILQRRWFKDLNLPVAVSDDDLLRIYLNVAPAENQLCYLAGAINNNVAISLISARATEFYNLCRSHVITLYKLQTYYADKYLLTDDDTYKAKLRRANYLLNRYNDIAATDLRGKILDRAIMLDTVLKTDFKAGLSIRLKQARKAAGLSQQLVANKLGLGRNAYTLYENGKRDIPTLTLAKLSIILNQSADWLLGIKN